MALPATDAFTGADDASIGANWTFGANTFVIASNQAVGDNSSTDCYAWWNADSFGADSYSKASIAGLSPGAQYKGVIARAAGAGGTLRCYLCYTDGTSGSGHTEIGKVTGGTFSALKAVATTFANADVLEIRCTGTTTTTIALYKNGVLIDSVDDSSSPHVDGAAGIHCFGETEGLDNWEGGNLASDTTTPDELDLTGQTAVITGFREPEFVAAGTAAEANGGNLTLNEPAGVLENDILVAVIAYRDTPAFASGTWTQIQQHSTGNTSTTTNASIGSFAAFWIRRGSSAPSYVFTRTAGNVARGTVLAYRNCLATGDVIAASSINTLAANSATVTTGTITTPVAKCMLVFAMGGADNTTSASYTAATDPTSGWNERHDSNTATGADTTIAAADVLKTTTGSTGTVQCTAGNSSRHVGFVCALKPSGTATAITAGSQALDLAEQAGAATLARNITAAVAALTLAEVSAAISIGSAINANAAALTLTEQATATKLSRAIAAQFQELTLTEQAAVVVLATQVQATHQNLTLAEAVAAVALAGAGYDIGKFFRNPNPLLRM